MLQFETPVLPVLKPLVQRLCDAHVDVYLNGYLGHQQLLFVDVDWQTSEILQAQLSAPWTLIYAYFLSSDAMLRGEPDPLLSGMSDQVEQLLVAYNPGGILYEQWADEVTALKKQAEYLMQFPPSRLVYTSTPPIAPEDIDALMATLTLVP